MSLLLLQMGVRGALTLQLMPVSLDLDLSIALPQRLQADLVPVVPIHVNGDGNDAHLVHDQQTAADTWEITHNLGKYPAVTVIDSAGDQVEGDLQYLGLNTVRITFGAAFSGRAFFN